MYLFNIINLLPKGIGISLTLNKKIFILAGESSGDYIGSFLMDGLQDRNNKKLTFFGVGGSLMQKKGLKNKFDMNNLNIIGLANSIYNYKCKEELYRNSLDQPKNTPIQFM